MTFMPSSPGRCAGCPRLAAAFYADDQLDCASRVESLRCGSRAIPAHRTIYRENEPAGEIYVIFDGWAFRYKLLPDGRRQILSILLPGDPLGLPLLYGDRLPFSVQSLTAVSICRFPRTALSGYVAARPALARRAELLCAQATAAAEERLLDLGRRTAYERVGRFILELMTRLQAKGLCDGSSAHFPLRHIHIADSLGLTPIHVGRVLRRMQADRLLSLSRDRLEIHDLAALQRL